MLDDEITATVPLHALSAVDKGGVWRRLSDSVALWFHGLRD